MHSFYVLMSHHFSVLLCSRYRGWPKKLVFCVGKEDEEELCVMLNRKVKYTVWEPAWSDLASLRFTLHSRITFSRPKIMDKIELLLGVSQKSSWKLILTPSANQTSDNCWLLKFNVTNTGWVRVTFLTVGCGLFASKDIFKRNLTAHGKVHRTSKMHFGIGFMQTWCL